MTEFVKIKRETILTKQGHFLIVLFLKTMNKYLQILRNVQSNQFKPTVKLLNFAQYQL